MVVLYTMPSLFIAAMVKILFCLKSVVEVIFPGCAFFFCLTCHECFQRKLLHVFENPPQNSPNLIQCHFDQIPNQKYFITFGLMQLNNERQFVTAK